MRIDELAAALGVRLGNQLGRRNLDKGRVGVKACPIRIGQFLCLHKQVPEVRGQGPHFLEIIGFQDI